MDETLVRAHSQKICDALIAGEMDRATEDFSSELRSNLGEVIAQLPLPVTEATVESVDVGGKGLVVVLLLVGETETVRLQTRWKDRDGEPTVVEVSHMAEEVAPPSEPEPEE